MEINVKYTGKYPSLCKGYLTVTIDGKKWTFPKDCMSIGGEIEWDDIGNCIEYDGWMIDEWPEEFPEKFKKRTLRAINKEVKPECCGKCEERKRSKNGV
jgi:hypothetical protein